jgi:hypothetical protein
MSIAEKLRKLLDIKAAIKEALFFVGQEVADKMEDWAMAIRNICNVPLQELGWENEEMQRNNIFVRQAIKNGEILKRNLENTLIDYIYYSVMDISVHFNNISRGEYFYFPLTNVSYVRRLALTYIPCKGFPFLYLDELEELNLKIQQSPEFKAYTPKLKKVTFMDSYSLQSIQYNSENVESYDQYCFGGSISRLYLLREVKISGIGTKEECNSINFKSCQSLGVNSENYPNARENLIYTLLESSYDRASAGYSVFTINLRQETFNLLTEEEITAITNKGYTITV